MRAKSTCTLNPPPNQENIFLKVFVKPKPRSSESLLPSIFAEWQKEPRLPRLKVVFES